MNFASPQIGTTPAQRSGRPSAISHAASPPDWKPARKTRSVSIEKARSASRRQYRVAAQAMAE